MGRGSHWNGKRPRLPGNRTLMTLIKLIYADVFNRTQKKGKKGMGLIEN